MASSPAARGCTDRQTSDGELKLGSPVIDWWRWFGWKDRRRAAATDRWWRGRGHSNSGEDRGGAGQRVARVASLVPSGGAGMVGWLGGRAESRARRRRQWGSRREPWSNEQVEQPGQHASVQALWVREEALGVLGALGLCGAVSSPGRHRWRTAAARCSRAWRKERILWTARGGWGVAWAPRWGQSRCGSRHGRSTADRAATCARGAGVRRQRRWPGGVGRFHEACEHAVRGNGGLGANDGGRPWDRRSQGCSGGRARSAGGSARRDHKHDVARGRERLAWHPEEIDLALFKRFFLKIFELK
jgi:hypothetical protein